MEIAVRNRIEAIAFLDALLFPFSLEELLDEELVNKILLCKANGEMTQETEWIV